MAHPAILEASIATPLLALTLCSALLWVGAAVAWEVRAPGALRTRSLDWVALVLVAAGLWWPAHATSGAHATSQGLTLVLVVLLGGATAFVARLGVLAPWLHPQQLLGSGGVLLAGLAFLSLLNALPGEGLNWTPSLLMAAAVAFAAALRGLHRPVRRTLAHMSLRSACAVVAAGVLSAVTWREAAPMPALDATLVPMAALVALGGLPGGQPAPRTPPAPGRAHEWRAEDGPRRADGAAQPQRARGAPDASGGTLRQRAPTPGADDRQPRRLQAGQCHLRPPHRRPGAEEREPAVAPADATQGPAGAPGRRHLRGAAHAQDRARVADAAWPSA